MPSKPLPVPKPVTKAVPVARAVPITMDAVYAAPGYLFRRMQQIAVAIFVAECRAFDLTPVQ